MSATPSVPGPAGAAGILVVDDDPRVREFLEIAFTAHGFGVITAGDGEEAIARARAERPDLVVLDVRLPKKSGLDVCDALRRDPDDPAVPIILVSGAAETEIRLQGFARGADDFLAKPFSPKELIARVRRLLSRSAEARSAARRVRDLERDLARVREEGRRAGLETRRERMLRDLAYGLGSDLNRLADADAVAGRLLAAIQAKLEVGATALLVRERPGGALTASAVRGDCFERVAGLEVRADGALGELLAGLGRPATVVRLAGIPEIRAEVAPFVAARFAGLAALGSPGDLVAVAAFDERLDGTALAGSHAQLLAGLCEVGAIALRNALRLREPIARLLEFLEERAAQVGPGDATGREARALVAGAARFTMLPPRQRDLARHALALGDWARGAEGCGALARLRAADPTGWIEELEGVLALAAGAEPADAVSPEDRRAAALIAVGLGYAEARSRGIAIEEALAAAAARAGGLLDLPTRHALAVAAREVRD